MVAALSLGATATAIQPAAALTTAAQSTGTWANAVEIPGTATLNVGGAAYGEAVSCPSPGNCSAGGSYADASGEGHEQAFVVNEVARTWGNAKEVPGSATLNAGDYASVDQISCPSAGNCSASGDYTDGSGKQQIFVVNELAGTWGNAKEAPGSAILDAGGDASDSSLSCASAGNCVMSGWYTDGSSHRQALVVDETNGTWGNAEEVPGSATLNAGGYAMTYSVSCPSPGNCAMSGHYTDASGKLQAFVATQSSGIWRSAEEAPGSAALNAHGNAALNSISCASAGNCSAGGNYADASDHEQSFVVDETAGKWGNAEEVPGSATLNTGVSGGGINTVACSSAGNCSAGGYYSDSSDHLQAFVVNETNGTWGKAEEVPGSATLNAGGSSQVYTMSCISAGNCTGAGGYSDASDKSQAYVVDETNGTWGSIEEVPGSGTLNAGGNAEVNSLSCSAGGTCAGVGSYRDASPANQTFFANYTPGSPAVTRLSPASGSTSGGSIVTISGSNLFTPVVRFGAAAAKVDKVLSATEIEVTAPKGSGTVDVTVTTAGGISVKTAADHFSYVLPPAVTKLAPNKGPTSGGTTVTISGKNLLAPTAVYFGAVKATIHKVVSATEVEVISPKGTGTVDVTVTTAGGTSPKTVADRFTY
jgi:hypothetical protein